MANRTMQQKSMKLRRERRAWAKKYSMQSQVTGPNRGVLQEYKERACGLGVSEFEIDETIKRLYKRDPIHGIAAGKVEVLQTLAELKKRVPDLLSFVVMDNCFHRVVCMFNSEQTRYSLAHTDKRKHLLRTSREYYSKKQALEYWTADKVTWISEVSAPPSL
jgi:hypothetical protein